MMIPILKNIIGIPTLLSKVLIVLRKKYLRLLTIESNVYIFLT